MNRLKGEITIIYSYSQAVIRLKRRVPVAPVACNPPADEDLTNLETVAGRGSAGRLHHRPRNRRSAGSMSAFLSAGAGRDTTNATRQPSPCVTRATTA